LSKIELENVELISGFDSAQFNHCENLVKTEFSSLRESSEIEWLESENAIKQERKDKLERIQKKSKKIIIY